MWFVETQTMADEINVVCEDTNHGGTSCDTKHGGWTQTMADELIINFQLICFPHSFLQLNLRFPAKPVNLTDIQ